MPGSATQTAVRPRGGFALVQATASILLMTQALFPVGVAMFGLGQCSLPHVVVEPFDGIADDAVLLELVEYLVAQACVDAQRLVLR